jgi:hypothetical protein
MADSVEMNDIRSLQTDKALKGFALKSYIFKNDCVVSPTSADSIRWYQETAADLTATAPSKVENISPLSQFPALEVTWTRNTSYPRKYAAEGFISMEDMKSADIDVLARTLLRLTRAVTKKVDERIWDVMTESQTPANIQTFATTAVGGDQWDAASYAGDPIKDLLHAKKLLFDYNYDATMAVAYMSPLDYESVVAWLFNKGAQAPSMGDSIAKGGVVTEVAGIKIKVSTNVTADYCAVAIPKTAVTWKEFSGITSRVIEEPGIGSKIRVWENGEAILTDPKAVVLISDTQT